MEAALVTAAARFMGEKVADLLQLNEKLQAVTGTKRKMEKLKDLSPIIDMVIQDVESRPFVDDAVKELLKKLKYLAYDLEDVVDYYDTHVLRKQISRTSFRRVRDFVSSNNQIVFKIRIGGMIKAIKDNLDSILLQKSFLLNLPQGTVRMSKPSPHGETHSCNSLVIIGRETEKKMIVNLLTNDDEKDESKHGTVTVISIVGMGGLGKTTLAQLVFHDEKVKAHFPSSSRMWKVVGAEFDPTKILKSVLELTTGVSADISEIDLVRQNLENALSGKRFLLVLDDVWNEDALKWGVLKATLTCGARGSKILVTTRNLHVSSIMDSFHTHQIQQLSRDDCLSLFQQFAFGDQTVDQNLMKIGENIIEKCGGVPLAAISLGSMLRSTRDETYWSSVLNNDIWHLGDDEQKVLAVLKWSYDTLPPSAKKCFAFGSLFPKDFMVKKDELIKLWIANGFVPSEGNFDAETVGNRIFDDLVLKSFFLLAPSNEHDFEDDSHVTKCTMHDLMHDLARSVSADAYWNSKQDLVKDIGNRTYHLCTHLANISRNILRVLGEKPLYLRTLVLSNCELYQNAYLFEIVFSELKFLRVLDLSCNNIYSVPAAIGNLIHLRYLNLSGNNIEVLPDSITLLLNLQYLCCDYFKLTHMPCGLSQLINLRSLPVFVAGDRPGACSIIELEDLKLHGDMAIIFPRYVRNYSCGGRKILKNKHLDELYLQFNGPESSDKDTLDDLCPNTSLKKLTIRHYWSRQFPAWLMESQLPNLVEISLENCRGWGHIPPFGNLHFLKKLDLEFMDGITHMDAEFHGHGGFPSLQKFYLSKMYNLNEWQESHGVDELFPLLQKLCIFRCPKLKSMPRFPRIQELEISYCSGSLLPCVGRLTSLSVLKVEEMDGMTSLPSGCIRNLTSLTELQIIKCRQLQSLSGDEMQHLTSLTELQIKGCRQLQYLPGDEMQHLKMIRSLTIDSCDSLASFPSEVGRLSSLCFLQLTGCPSIIISQPDKLVQILNSVPEFQIAICGKNVNLRGQLQHLLTLRELFLTGAHDMLIYHKKATQLVVCCCEELEWLMTGEPTSTVLQHLEIRNISNLTTLPDWLQHLKSLSVLVIRNCSQLGKLPRGLKNLAPTMLGQKGSSPVDRNLHPICPNRLLRQPPERPQPPTEATTTQWCETATRMALTPACGVGGTTGNVGLLAVNARPAASGCWQRRPTLTAMDGKRAEGVRESSDGGATSRSDGKQRRLESWLLAAARGRKKLWWLAAMAAGAPEGQNNDDSIAVATYTRKGGARPVLWVETRGRRGSGKKFGNDGRCLAVTQGKKEKEDRKSYREKETER